MIQPKTGYIRINRFGATTAEEFTAALKELLQKDYKIVDEPPPVGKDFNDFLLSYLGIARPISSRERSDAR